MLFMMLHQQALLYHCHDSQWLAEINLCIAAWC